MARTLLIILTVELFISMNTEADNASRASGGLTLETRFVQRWQVEMKGSVSSLAWSADGKRFAAVDDDDRGNSIFDMDARHRISYWRSRCFLSRVGIALMPDGQTAISCPQLEGENPIPSVVSIFDTNTGSRNRIVIAEPGVWGESSFAQPFDLSRDGKNLVAVPLGVAGRLVVFNTWDWSVKQKFEWGGNFFQGYNLGQSIKAIAFSHDAQLIAVGAASGAIGICSVNTSNCQTLVDGPGGEVTSLAFTSDDKLLISANRTSGGAAPPADSKEVIDRSKMHLSGWDVVTQKKVISSSPDDLSVHFLSIHPSGAFFAVSYRDHQDISIYATSTFEKIYNISTKKSSGAISFSPDGKFLALSDKNSVVFYSVYIDK